MAPNRMSSNHTIDLDLDDGTSVRTLDELWPEEPRAMIVGLNPAPTSVAAGHYYQGKSGQQRMRLLINAGLFREPNADESVDDVAFADGVGFADLVRRPTVSEKVLGKEEIKTGADRLRAELTRRHVPLVISVYRHAAVHFSSNKKAKPGFVNPHGIPGTNIFRMPGPYAAAEYRDEIMGELREFLGEQPA
jgi:TDG/mug DNA glycosylase family protein